MTKYKKPAWATSQWTRHSGLVEDICEHGVGHPNRDYLKEHDPDGTRLHGVHGCDGCCHPEHPSEALQAPSQDAKPEVDPTPSPTPFKSVEGFSETLKKHSWYQPEEVLTTNEHGGMNSEIGVRYDLIPPKVLRLLATTLAEGAEKYEDNNWRQVDADDHLNHALNHIVEYLIEPTEEHLSHGLCRLVMFISQEVGDE